MTLAPQRVSEGDRAPRSHTPTDAKHGTEQEPSQRRETPQTSPAPLPKPSAVIGRRSLLQWLGLGGAAVALAPTPAPAAGRKRNAPGVLVFRLTTRRHYTCNACKRHHRFPVFRTHALADANRAHPGCNCPIIRQKLPKKDFAHLFGPRGVAPGGVADLRRTPLQKPG